MSRHRQAADIVLEAGSATVKQVHARMPQCTQQQVSSALAEAVRLGWLSRTPRKRAGPRAWVTTYCRP